MKKKELKVFVSSVCTEVIEEYQFTTKTIRNVGHIPLSMELFNGISERSLEKIMFNYMSVSDAYILMLGGQYASNKNDLWISYLESEYIKASCLDLPILIIIIDDSYLSAKSNSRSTMQIFDNDSNSYNNFVPLEVTSFTVVYPAKNLSDIRVAIIWFLNVICEMGTLKYSLYGYRSMFYHEPTPNQKQSQTPLISINPKDLKQYKKIDYYYNPTENINIKSFPDIAVKECIVDPLGNPISDINNIRTDVNEINDWMLNELKKNPTDLYQLSSRRFEELIAEIFIRKGYNVELTPATRDGGKDIYVAYKNDFGSFLYVVECKKYKPNHKVRVNVLRDLYGVLSKEKATYGIAVTTSYFSKPAKEFQKDIQFQMALQDFDSIKKWLCDVT